MLHYTIIGQSYVISANQQPAFGGNIWYTQGDNQQWQLGQLHNTRPIEIHLEWHKHISHARECMEYPQSTPSYTYIAYTDSIGIQQLVLLCMYISTRRTLIYKVIEIRVQISEI